MSKLSPPRIVCAANRYEDGTIIVGPRHFDKVMQAQLRFRRPAGMPAQGFIDQHGEFYSRQLAWVIAERNGQVVKRCGGDGPEGEGLFSENLY